METPNPSRSGTRPLIPESLAGRTVLVVDDQSTVRYVARTALLDAGMEVLEATCAEDALGVELAALGDAAGEATAAPRARPAV